jgi:hypothetical protein
MRTTRVWAMSAAITALFAAARAADEPDELPPQATEVVLDAPVGDVWRVFTTAEGWKAFGVAHAEVDLHVLSADERIDGADAGLGCASCAPRRRRAGSRSVACRKRRRERHAAEGASVA